jgi:translation initiation factor 1
MTKNKIAYREFGAPEPEDDSDSSALDLPPQQQNLRIQASRKGRKGKTVTVISGFQASPETLTSLVKQLKNYCGAGGTVKENEIEIQGDCAPKTLQFLLKLGYKAKISGG